MKDKIILSMDLSLNGSALAITKLVKDKFKIIDIIYIDNNKIKERKTKLFNIYSNSLVTALKYKPSLIIKEREFSRHIKSTKAISEVDGVVQLALFNYNNDYNIELISPITIKKFITKNTKATKQEVQNDLRRYLIKEQKEYYFKTLDCSDSVAVAIAYKLKNEGV